MAGMKHRKLRIAWSAVWGILCLLLIVLWVRSYDVTDGIIRGSQTSSKEISISISSDRGTLMFGRLTFPIGQRPFAVPKKWTYYPDEPGFGPIGSKFVWRLSDEHFIVRFPTELPAALFAILATAPWIRWRFSLRALLIGMTVVAVGLGLALWALSGN
jgi:hypothetical protein